MGKGYDQEGSRFSVTGRANISVPIMTPAAAAPQDIGDKIARVIAALNNEKYDWRTVNGIAEETKIDGEEVRRILAHLVQRQIGSKICCDIKRWCRSIHEL